MHRLSAIILACCFLALGSGVVEYLHNIEHAREDAVALAANPADASHPEHQTHDESNCSFHAQLHVPIMSGGWVVLLVALGLFVAFLSMQAPDLVPHFVPSRLICRGPPVR